MPNKKLSSDPDTSIELRASAEERLKQKNLSTGSSALSTSSSPEEMRRIIHDLSIHHIEHEIQQEELDQSRIALKQSLDLVTELYDYAPAAYVLLSQDCKILRANLKAAKMLGVGCTPLLQMNFNQFVVPGDKRIIEDLLQKVFTERATGYVEVKLQIDPAKSSAMRPAPVEIFVRLDAAVTETSDLCRVILTDITLQKKTAYELRKSERNFRSITQHIAEVVVVGNENGTVTYVSSVAEKMFGYLHDDVIGHSVTEFFADDDVPAALKVFNGTLTNKTPKQVVELRMKRKDGTIFQAAIHLQYYQDEYNSGFIGLVWDFTERRQAELKTQEISDRYAATIEAAQIGTWDWNVETGEVILNNRWCEIVGYSLEELAPVSVQTWKKLAHPDDFIEFMAIPEKLCQGTSEFYENEFRMKHKNGHWVWVLDRGKLMTRTADGKPLRMLGTHIDITDRKQAEDLLQNTLQDLIASKEKAEESERLKSAFIANLSHEIRTPMNGILGFTALLKDPHLTGEEQSEFIGLIHKSGERLLNLIKDLMDISCIDARETKLQITETPVNRLLEDLYVFFKTQAAQKGLRLNYNTGLPDTESIINTDSTKLMQMLTNLLQNALKFTIKGTIDFGYTRKDNNLEFYVIDSGIGIPTDNRERIFDRFHQADNSLTRNYEGAGLGLSITKSFVEMLGGTIRVESVEGAGSTFSFTLPYNPVPLPINAAPATQPAANASKSLTILIVEDDDLSTILLKKSLKQENFTILYAENGWEAVEIVSHHPEISIVLMDIQMPIMNGFEATKLIKKQRLDLPVIVQSAYTSEEDREKAKKAGADAFITKPMHKSELLDMMSKLLKH